MNQQMPEPTDVTPEVGARRRELRAALIGLVLVCVAALWVRTRNLDYLLPHAPEPDLYSVVQVEHLRAKALGGNQPAPFQFYFYPMLLARIHLAIPEAPPPATPDGETPLLENHLAAAGSTLERSRTIVAWLSILTIPATFAIALFFTRPWIALLAAALAGTSLLHLQFSGQARPHGMAAGWVAVAIAVALWIRRRPTPLTYLVGGIAGMLAICSLQNGSAALLALGAAFVLRDRDEDQGGWLKLLIPISVITGGVLFLYAFFVEKAEVDTTQSYTSLRIEDDILKYGGHEIDLGLFRGAGFAKLDDFLRWNDPTLLWGSLAGLLVVLGTFFARRCKVSRSRLADVGVLLAHAVPYTIALGLFEKTFERYLLPLLPILSLLSAVGIAGGVSLLTRPLGKAEGARTVLVIAVCLGSLVLPLRHAWMLSELRGRPDTFEELSGWLANYTEPGDLVLTGPGTILPTFYDPELIPELDPGQLHVQWLRYQLTFSGLWSEARRIRVQDAFIRGKGVDPETLERLETLEGTRAWMDEQAPDWFVLEPERSRIILGKDRFNNLRTALEEKGRIRANIRPHPVRRDRWRDYQDAEEAISRIRGGERLGPHVILWSLGEN